MLQTLVPGATQTCIFLMENPYSLILARISIANFSATVRTAIIHQQQLKIGKRLRQKCCLYIQPSMAQRLYTGTITDISGMFPFIA